MSPDSPSTQRYENRVCVITCAGSGIGHAITLRLAAEGGMVIPADIDADAAAQTVAMTGSGRAAKVDVRPEDSVGRMAELVAEAGRVDLLVNNAGIEILGDITDTPPEVWERYSPSTCAVPRAVG